MKKLFTLSLILFAFVFFKPDLSYSQQDSNNVLLEYCTGTWCGYCPCGHQIIDVIMSSFPKTVVLAYHGYTGSGDPWVSYSAGIIGLMGMNSYPTGVIGRRTGIISRGAWYGQVNAQVYYPPGVRIALNVNYNPVTRLITATADNTALDSLTGDYYINFVLTEGHIVYQQTIYASCGTAGVQYDYVHNHVVKGMLNGNLGEIVNTGSLWPKNEVVTKSVNYTLPAGILPENCQVAAFVYLSSGSITSTYYVQQAVQKPIVLTGINNQNENVKSYELYQNFPNPFNPVTHIRFDVPKNQVVSLKVYDILGNEVSTLINGYVTAGIYNAEFDAKNLASGIYFYKFTAGDFTKIMKMMLTK